MDQASPKRVTQVLSSSMLGLRQTLTSPRRWPWRARPEPPDPCSFAPASILLASEGRRIPVEAVEFAFDLSRRSKAPIHVFGIARIWGSGFGLPHPGLMPSKREWQSTRDIVAEAVDLLRRRGVVATGSVVSSRNAARRILAEAKRRRPDAIVMAAPPPRPRLVAGFLWEYEPYRVRRAAERPVYLVIEGQQTKSLPRPCFWGDWSSRVTKGPSGPDPQDGL